MKITKRFIALALVLALTLSCTVSVSASSTSDSTRAEYSETFVYNGESYTYEVYSNGTSSIWINDTSSQISKLTIDEEGVGNAEISNEGTEIDYHLVINEMSDNDIDILITADESNGSRSTLEEYHFTSIEDIEIMMNGNTSARELVSLSVISLSTLLYVLIQIAKTIVIASVTYIAISAVIEAIKESTAKKKYYYSAYLSGKEVYINYASSISVATATSRILAGKSFYTYFSSYAYSAVSAAGLGVIGPEIDTNKKTGYIYYKHYHTGNRNGAHGWFGTPYTA